MFSAKHYVPILKGKEGEFMAIRKTSANAISFMTPIIELMDFVPLVLSPDKLAKRRKALPTFESDIKNDIKSISDFWKGNGNIFIDVHLISLQNLYSSTPSFLIFIFDELYKNGINAIPVIYTDSDWTIFDDVRRINKSYNCGVAIRLVTEELVSKDFLEKTQTALELNPKDIDIIIDYDSIIGKNVDTLVESAQIFINKTLYSQKEWRTLTVASSAFPVDLGDYDPLTEGDIFRNDWLFWKKLVALDLARKPSFGDYSIAHPDIQVFKDFPNVSASIRYTTSETWKIMRGQGTKRRGWDQIRERCKELIKLPVYDGPEFSWADKYIKDCADSTVGTGGAKEWRQIANNRHFEKVTHLISKYNGL